MILYANLRIKAAVAYDRLGADVVKIEASFFIAFLFLIACLNTNFFYLIDDNSIPISDITIVFELLFGALVFLFVSKNKKKLPFKWLYLMPIALAVASSYMASINYDQPIQYGFRAQRGWLVACLMIFPVFRLLSSGKIKKEDLLRISDFVAFILICLATVQIILTDHFTFMHVMTNERYGAARIYIDTSFILFSYFSHLSNLIKFKKARKIDYFYIVLTWFEQFFITKSRMSLMELLVATLLALCVMKLNGKKLVASGITVFLFALVLNTPYGQMILTSLSGSALHGAGETIRLVGKDFYLDKLGDTKSNTLFGCGYVNIDWPTAYSRSRYGEGIFYNDNGIVGLMFYYGLFFLLWMVTLSIVLLVYAYKLKEYGCFLYIICTLIGFYSLLPYCYVNNLSFAFVISICLYKSKLVGVGR